MVYVLVNTSTHVEHILINIVLFLLGTSYICSS